MNNKATAQCSNGHTFEWGTCKGTKKKLFGGTQVCGARGFEQVYADGSRLSVSFDDRPFVSIWCGSCKTEFTSTPCPQCGVEVPASAFRKKGLLANLG